MTTIPKRACGRCDEPAGLVRLVTVDGREHFGHRCPTCGMWVGGLVPKQRLRALGADLDSVPSIPSAARRAAEEQPRLF